MTGRGIMGIYFNLHTGPVFTGTYIKYFHKSTVNEYNNKSFELIAVSYEP
jgi:hypothetical protein